jgi:hypothetical protein
MTTDGLGSRAHRLGFRRAQSAVDLRHVQFGGEIDARVVGIER